MILRIFDLTAIYTVAPWHSKYICSALGFCVYLPLTRHLYGCASEID